MVKAKAFSTLLTALILSISPWILSPALADTPGIWAFTGPMGGGRARHTATLLPNGQVLIAGGDSSFSGSPYAAAELYNPTTGSFSATGAMGTARREPSATLLPNGQVLVAGGFSGGTSANALATAELYNPATGTFTATGSMGTRRLRHTATLLPSGKVLIAGGDTVITGVPTATAELYDPATGTFTATGAMGTARGVHTATLLPNGKVLIAGGVTAVSTLSSAELYDPATGTFSPTGAMGTARDGHTATLLSNGKVLIAGGDLSVLAELYDPATGTFTATGAMGTARRGGHTAALLANGLVLIAGGFVPGPGTFNFATVELYDPATGSFTATGTMELPRRNHTATPLASGQVLVTGGFDRTSFGNRSAELYFAQNTCLLGTWAPTGSMVESRNGPVGRVLPNGQVLVAGGFGGPTTGQLASAELYAPILGSFTLTAGSMGTARGNHTATLFPDNGTVLIAGGFGRVPGAAFSNWLKTAELYDTFAGTFVLTGSMGAARGNHTATLLPSGGQVLVAGGYNGTAALSSAELYRANPGTFAPTGSMGAARNGHTATLLPNGKVLIAGGTLTVAAAELFDPAPGSFSATGAMVTRRAGHTATWLPNGKVLIAGGDGGSGFLASAELYDPVTGSFSATGAMGGPRSGHRATLLPNGSVLIAGGASSFCSTVPCSPLASAELYIPASGTFSPTGTMGTARESHIAAFLGTGRVVVAGGFGTTAPLASAEVYPTVRCRTRPPFPFLFPFLFPFRPIPFLAVLLALGLIGLGGFALVRRLRARSRPA